MFKKLKYFPDAVTLFKITKNWYDIPLLIWGIKNKILLKNGLWFYIIDYMNLLQIVEIIENEDYKVSVKSPKVILDIGANIGDSSIYLAKKFPKSKIYAFEPVKKTYNCMLKNLAINKTSNVIPVNAGVSKSSGSITIYSNPLSGMSGLTRNVKNAKTEKIKVLRLGEFFDKYKIKNCDLAKIDCEGAEYEILLNTDKKTIKKIKNFIVEYHKIRPSDDYGMLVKFFKEMGYKVSVRRHKIERDIGIIRALS